ncbi:MAG TPA: hypothetical protein VK983_00500 [Candidatus Limnocylindrales bacterium]|nr:hypothetical protein [Candidatus Limnocylindrales bacterium]
MGETLAAASIDELSTILLKYGISEKFEIVQTTQLDPDTSLFTLQFQNAQMYYVLEADYVSSLEDVISRFDEYGITGQWSLVELVSPPPAFDYQPYIDAKPDYFTKDRDDYNRLRLYETYNQPQHYVYGLRYFVAQVDAGQAVRRTSDQAADV